MIEFNELIYLRKSTVCNVSELLSRRTYHKYLANLIGWVFRILGYFWFILYNEFDQIIGILIMETIPNIILNNFYQTQQNEIL